MAPKYHRVDRLAHALPLAAGWLVPCSAETFIAARMAASHTTIVVPCYNEGGRLEVSAFLEFAREHPSVRFLLVDDGSTDRTPAVLADLVSRAPEQFEWLRQPRNAGKAETVREGVLRAMAGGPRYVGYWDADLATPLREVPRFIAMLDAHPHLEACFGARVQLLGRVIERRAHRHYLGRVFATAASLTLGLPVYDTQCGAKLFRASRDVEDLFVRPFLTTWCFDVEVIARLAAQRRQSGRPGPRDIVYELPLDEWRDVAGSKVRPTDFFRAFAEILRIHREYLR
jgi:dolichyl-phosphate beta-glucosyltransferase